MVKSSAKTIGLVGQAVLEFFHSPAELASDLMRLLKHAAEYADCG